MPSKDAPRDLELLILGGMLRSKEYRTICLTEALPEDFRDKDTRELFRAIKDVAELKDGASDALGVLAQKWLLTEGTTKFVERLKRLTRARWQAAKLKQAGRWANENDADECEELWAKFQAEMQFTTPKGATP